jgi:CheY-like chemotaxis protein
MNVLLIEDDELVRASVFEMLTDAGLSVVPASSVAEALALLDGADAPAVLVADMHLGAGMDGYRLAAAARRRWPSIRTVLISGDDEIAERVCGPIDSFLAKPFRGVDLLQAISGESLEASSASTAGCSRGFRSRENPVS